MIAEQSTGRSTLSLHYALPISWDEPRELSEEERLHALLVAQHCGQALARAHLYEAERRARAESETLRERAAFLASASALRSEEHTSELQSQSNLVCRLLLEKKK